MVNQERVCEMTRLAIFDQNEGETCKPMIQYIAKELLKSFVTGTIAFGLLAAMFGLYCVENLIEQINTIDIREMITGILICYAVYLAVYFVITYIVYYVRYSRGRQKVKKYYLHLKKVNRLYREEEQI